MRAAFRCGCDKIQQRCADVREELPGEHAPPCFKCGSKFVFSPQYHVCQYFGSDHGAGHPPKIEARRNINIWQSCAVSSDIGHSVKAHAILICPCVFFLCLWKIALCKCAGDIKSAALLAGAMVSAANYQESVIVAEVYAVFCRIHYGTAKLRGMFKCNYK